MRFTWIWVNNQILDELKFRFKFSAKKNYLYADKLPVNDLRRISTAMFTRLFLSENGRVVTNAHHLRMLCPKFGWNWPSGSGEDKNMKSLQTNRQTDNRWPEKFPQTFNFGKLKCEKFTDRQTNGQSWWTTGYQKCPLAF